MENFTYVDETKIDPDLKCSLCKKPFVNPVSLPKPCEQIFCLACIQGNLEDHSNKCDACQNKALTEEDLHPEDLFLRKKLDQLLVQCSACHQKNIPRVKREQHTKDLCPKRTVHCPGKDVMCSWTGHADKLPSHAKTCPYEAIRDNLIGLIEQGEFLKKSQMDCEDLVNQLKNAVIEKTKVDQQNEQLQIENERLNKDLVQQKTQIDQLNEQVKKIEQLQTEKQCLNEQLELRLTEINKHKKDNQSLNEEISRLKKIETDYEYLMKKIDELNQWKDDRLPIEEQLQHYQTISRELETFFQNLKTGFQKHLMVLQRSQMLISQLRLFIQAIMAQINSLTEEIKILKRQLEDTKPLRDAYQKLHEKFEQQEIQLDVFRQENLTLKKEIANHQLQIEHRDISLKKLQHKPMLEPSELSVNCLYENRELKELLDQFSKNSLITLNDIRLNDIDIDIVITHAFIYKKCHSIVLWNNSLTTNSTLKLFSSLKWNRTLTKLSISNNHLSDKSMQCLCESLSYDNQILKELSLNSNEISDQGLIYFSDALKSNDTLITIGLQNNQIGDQSIQYLAEILISYLNSIENLSLYSNRSITDLSVQPLIKIIQKKITLKTLWIWDCELSVQGKDQIKQSIESSILLDLKL